MKFQVIKTNAKRTLASAFAHWGFVTQTGVFLEGGEDFVGCIEPFVLASQDSRAEIREFVAAFMTQDGQWITASAAKGEAMHAVASRARKAGLLMIDQWEIENLGKLIELFPLCVPLKFKRSLDDSVQSGLGVLVDGRLSTGPDSWASGCAHIFPAAEAWKICRG